MGMIDVCFYNQNIYNLEDLSIVGELPKGSSITLYEYLDIIKQKYTIRIAIMDFNHPLRNAVYSVFPSVSIIIHPLDVMEMISNYLGSGQFTNNNEEEIAAGVENEKLIIREIGCQGIYYNNTKKEAINYYRQWQGDVPLGVKCFHNVIRTMDYYYEEIFNYFEFKDLFNAETL